MAEPTLAGQDFGNEIEEAEFDMVAPGMTGSSITPGLPNAILVVIVEG